MPKVKKSYLEAQRDKILDAATVCFAQKGFIRTTIPDICRGAQLSIGAVYRYFPNKEDIIVASVQRHRKDRAKLLIAAEEKENAQHTLEELFKLQVFRLLSSEPSNHAKMMLYCYGEALYNPLIKNIVQSDWQEMNSHLEKMIQKAQKTGEINPAFDPQAVAVLMNAISDGLFLQRVLAPDSRIVLEQALELARRLFMLAKV